MRIVICENGSYIVSGNVPLYKADIIEDDDNFPIKIANKEKITNCSEPYTLCRCGESKNKPFCDGTHIEINFDGEEIVKKTIPEEDILTIETEKLKLIDIPILCDHSRFCTRAGGIRKLMKDGDEDDVSLEMAKEQGELCPSGRLTIIDKRNNESTDKDLDNEIVLLYDTGKNKEGPIWVKGNIEIISSDGEKYEDRNKETLCRCGKSFNKPTCDGSHWLNEKGQKKFRKKWNID
ncbi:MAG: CDGSH iron-sulfur domain-containing protein [Methanobacteriaceae archaeon]|jgi:CDGSH-type Zn-finger protein|nr:CDGSH iron-sulfur domain-containing protein [Methanobacteriaceae archaeon]